jgi:hypothetical protein
LSVIVGIDPGVSGAIAILSTDYQVVHIYDMPSIEFKVGSGKRHWADEQRIFLALADHMPISHAFLEEFPPRAPNGRVAIAVMFHSIGMVRGVLAAMGVPRTSVPPQVWQGDLTVKKGKDGAHARARELMPKGAGLWFPKGSHGRSDAALIAYWGIREFQKIAG